MERPDTGDLVCLHLAAFEEYRERTTVPETITAAGIDEALALGSETIADRVALLSTLERLREVGLVEEDVRPVAADGRPRNVYFLTDRGRTRASDLRDRIESERAIVEDAGAESIPMTDLPAFFDAPSLGAALSALTEEGNVRSDQLFDTPFVDREDELDRFADLASTVRRRGSRTLFVGGETGIGKSAFVAEAADLARADGFTVRQTACRRDVTEPYRAIVDTVEGMPGGEQVRWLLSDAGRPTADDPEELSAQRNALFHDIADVFRERAIEAPLVVFVDDLQWADRATLSMFEYLSAEITEWIYPILFVGTYCAGQVDEDGPLASMLERAPAAERTSTLELGPLSARDTRSMVEGLVGRRGLPDEFVTAVHDQSGGNPLFVTESVTRMLEIGAVDPDAGQFPASAATVATSDAIESAVDDRLSVLDDDVRALVELGSVVGDTVSLSVLSAASPLDEPDVYDAVDLLERGRLWERVDEGTVHFSGGVVREVVYDGIDASRRRALHERVAEVLRSTPTDAADRRGAAVAHHLEQAGRSAEAIEFFLDAAERAADVYAHEDAVSAYERALVLAREANDGDRACAILESVGDVEVPLGRYASAEDRFAEVRERTDDDVVTQRMCRKQAEVRENTGDLEGALAAARDGLAVAGIDVDALGDDADGEGRSPPAEVAELLFVTGSVLRKRGELDAASDAAERAVAVAEATGDRRREANARRLQGVLAWSHSDFETSKAHFQASLDISREIDYVAGVTASLNNLGAVVTRQGDYETAREHFEESIEIDRERGHRRSVAIGLSNVAESLQKTGEVDAAERNYRESLETYREIGDRVGEAINLNNLAAIAADRGDYEDAESLYEQSIEIKRDVGFREGEAASLFAWGALELERDAYDAALARVADAMDLYEEIDHGRGIARCRLLRGTIHAQRGDATAARRDLEGAVDALLDVGSLLEALEGLGELAELCDREGDTADALAYCDRALSLVDDSDVADLREQRAEFESLRESITGT